MRKITLNSVVVGAINDDGTLAYGSPVLQELFADSPFFISRTRAESAEGELADGIIETPVTSESSVDMLQFYGFKIQQQ